MTQQAKRIRGNYLDHLMLGTESKELKLEINRFLSALNQGERKLAKEHLAKINSEFEQLENEWPKGFDS